MNLDACLKSAIDQGEINEQEAARIRALFEGYRRKAAAGGEADADIRAQFLAAKRLAAEAAEKRRRTLLAAKAQKGVETDLLAYRTAKGEQDVGEAAVQLLEHYGSAPFKSLEGIKAAIIARAHSDLSELLRTFERTRVAGVTPNRALLTNIVREAFGQATGDVRAAELAKAWGDVADGLRQRFNRAGGAIGKLEQWGLPQMHDPRALLAAGRETWKTQIRPRLDIKRMRHPLTGDPILESELDEVLDHVFDTITTDGWAHKEPRRTAYGRGALASQRAEHRFLIFKSADDWLGYAEEFSQGDAFASMMAHINMMARDVAALERFGPNPDAMLEFVKQTVTKAGKEKRAGVGETPFAGGASRAMNRANSKVRAIENMWATYRGSAEAPVNTTAANILAGSRNWLTASILGSATLSAVPTDPIYQTIARRMAGIPAFSTLYDVAKAFGAGDRHFAVRSGLILDSAMHVFSKQARYLGTLSGPEWTQYLADRVLAGSGLTAWTQAGRHAFGLEFMGAYAEHAGRSLDELRGAPRGTLEKAAGETLARWGFSAEEWDTIRGAALHERDGATFLRPNEIAAVDEGLAEKYLAMIFGEMEYAVPSGTLRGRAGIRGGTRPGTFWGEIVRSASMFKSFVVTFALLYGARFWRAWSSNKAAGAGYAAAVLGTTTLGGALSVWLKDIVAGRDPRPIRDEEGSPLPFMGAALLQGGGLGIYGDFLFADLNRYGGGITGMLTGPVVERLNTVRELTLGNMVQLADGEDTKFWEEARRFVDKNTPGHSLWYARLAWDRLLMDNLRRFTDPDADKAFRRASRYAEDLNTGDWWRRGENVPDRPPDLNPAR